MSRWMLALSLGLTMVACAGDKEGDSDDDDDGGFTFEDDTGSSGGGGDGYTVEMVTSEGTLVIQLEQNLTPETTDNFLAYVDAGFYDGGDGGGSTIFHRVIPDFVAQGGGYGTSGAAKDTFDPIPLETDVGLSNVAGTIAMARTSDPDSATSQFYFNLVDNTFLDYQSSAEPGYAVFGKVSEGMDVLETIEGYGTSGGTPTTSVEITSVSRL